MRQNDPHEGETRLRRLASLLDLTHDAIFVRDLDDVIVYWNRAAAEYYGWSSAEAVGHVSHALLKTVFPQPLDEITATLERTDRWEGELVHTTRDGSRVVVASRWSLRRDEQGRPAGVLATNNDITERKRAEAELRRGHAYMAEAQRLSHAGSYAWRPSDNSLTWSDETYRIYGLDRATRPTVEYVSERVHPEDRATLGQVIDDARLKSKDFDFEHRLLMPDGSVRHLYAVAKAVTDETGQVEFVGVVVDVTKEKEAEEERRANLRFLESMDRINRAIQGTNDIERMMSDALGATLSIFDCDRVALVYPCDPDAASARVVMARTRPAFPVTYSGRPGGIPVFEAYVRIFRALRATAGPHRLDARTDPPLTEEVRTLTGAQSLLGMAIHPKVDAPYMLALVQCSYERVWTEREVRLFQEIGRRLADGLTTQLLLGGVRESARRYQNIFQTAAVSILEQDCSRIRTAMDDLRAGGVQDFRRYFADHPAVVEQSIHMIRLVDVNDATLALFGAQSKEELMQSPGKVIVPETMPLLAEWVLAIAERRTSFAAEARLQTLHGDQLDVLLTIAFPPEPTTLESVLVSIMDVTARRRAEEALRRARADFAHVSTLTTMGELAASIAHELRQPLSAIAMNGSAALRWLNREHPDLDEARDAAARTVREAQRADGVIRGLRALVGYSALQRGTLDLNDAMQEVLELVRSELRNKDIAVHLDLAHDLPAAYGDRVQLQQVALNLILNGVEAMVGVTDRARVLVLRTERAEPGGVAVVVEDTGAGFEPAIAERIFDPFFTTKPSGLGIGLSLCRSIVDAHGGRISAWPRVPNGTAFRFVVPTVANDGTPGGDRRPASVAVGSAHEGPASEELAPA